MSFQGSSNRLAVTLRHVRQVMPCSVASGMGAYAEYLAVKAAAIARKPSNLSFEEAASVPVASQTRGRESSPTVIGGDTQRRSFLVLKEGGHLVSATQPVSPEEAARHRVSGAMMRLAPSGDVLGRIARLLEEGTIRPDVATVYALQDAAQAWKDIAGNQSNTSRTARLCCEWLSIRSSTVR